MATAQQVAAAAAARITSLPPDVVATHIAGRLPVRDAVRLGGTGRHMRDATAAARGRARAAQDALARLSPRMITQLASALYRFVAKMDRRVRQGQAHQGHASVVLATHPMHAWAAAGPARLTTLSYDIEPLAGGGLRAHARFSLTFGARSALQVAAHQLAGAPELTFVFLWTPGARAVELGAVDVAYYDGFEFGASKLAERIAGKLAAEYRRNPVPR
jgi:hypothetical protein